MRITAIEVLRKLRKYPLFNLTTLEKAVGKDKPYSRVLVHRLKQRNLIFQVEKDKYTLLKDPLVIASRIIWPSYVSCWAALRYHNLTEQLPQIIEVITTKKRGKKELFFGKTKIRFITVKPKYFFGFNKLFYKEFEVFIAEAEKALIDGALFKKVSFSEIRDIIKHNLNELNLERLTSHLIRIKNKSLIKRFGYILDNLGYDYHPSFKKYIDHNYIALDYSLPTKGKKNKRWRIIKNTK